ncbi:MAG: hypothetical protein GXO47_07610 [Chlorobi bacterium]|nr:hypothetical protein [Chlorobiota bacterium]
MEFILQLLAQLFAGPVEDVNNTTDIELKVKTEPVVSEDVEKDLKIEEQLEPNLFNVMNFH